MRRKIVFAKLFNQYDTYPDEWLFEIFRWMIQTGWNYRSGFPHGNGVYELLIRKSTCINCQECYDYFDNSYAFHDFDYIEKMKFTWMGAILSQDVSSYVKKWREDNNISFTGVRYLNLRIANKPISDQLRILFKAHRKKLSVQLNEYHPEAIDINNVLLIANNVGWKAILRYGGRWHHILAKQGEKPFADFLDDACKELARLTEEAK